MTTSSSLLNWVRSMLQTRREHPAFGMGEYVPVEADNPAVLAFLRLLEPDPDTNLAGETILCVSNLSRTAQGTRLRLSDWAGARLADIFGGTGFDAIPVDGQLPLTIGSRDFFWLSVTPAVSPAPSPPAGPAAGASVSKVSAGSGGPSGGASS